MVMEESRKSWSFKNTFSRPGKVIACRMMALGDREIMEIQAFHQD